MATGVCDLFRADFGVATTGYAQADPENGIKKPLAFLCVCQRGQPDVIMEKRLEFSGTADRNGAQDFFAIAAIRMLHELVSRQPDIIT